MEIKLLRREVTRSKETTSVKGLCDWQSPEHPEGMGIHITAIHINTSYEAALLFQASPKGSHQIFCAASFCLSDEIWLPCRASSSAHLRTPAQLPSWHSLAYQAVSVVKTGGLWCPSLTRLSCTGLWSGWLGQPSLGGCCQGKICQILCRLGLGGAR